MYKVFYKQTGKDEMYNIWHRSDEHMIIFMHESGGSIVSDEKIHPIEKGTLCFIGAGKYHYTLPDEPDKYTRSKVFIDGNAFERLLALLDKKSVSVGSLIYAKIDEAYFDEVDRIYKELSEANDLTLVYSSILRLLYHLEKDKTDGSLAVTDTVGRAVEYISENIYNDINIDDICSSVHITKYHLCRTFKRKMGMTIMDYVLKTRIVLAKSLLVSTEKAVSEVSSACGFSSISYFCRSFKENTGKTPLEYRKSKG